MKCLDCKYLSLWGATLHYSDPTPGEPMKWCCQKGHYEVSEEDMNRLKLKSVLDIGKNCGNFVQESLTKQERNEKCPLNKKSF